jgi:hypothetical protein
LWFFLSKWETVMVAALDRHVCLMAGQDIDDIERNQIAAITY